MPCSDSKSHYFSVKRLHKLSTHLVLGSFLIQTLMPSYAWAMTDVMQSNPYSRTGSFQTGSFQTGPLRTGIMVRISKVPPLKKPLQQQASASAVLLPESHLMSASDMSFSDDEEGGMSDAALSEADSSIIYLDDHWMQNDSLDSSPVISSPIPSVLDILTAKHSGYLFTREADGSLRVACDPSMDAAQRSQNMIHILHEEQNVTVDGLGDIAGLVVHQAKHV